ncbi:MAG: hypothetical protein HON04_09560 [Planctomicrobium sp.]|nr:hypothetical protein [Planctomicrobium sp.]
MASSVFEIRMSVEDWRPFTLHSLLPIISKEYQHQIKVIRGSLPVSEWKGLDFECRDEGVATDWDFFDELTGIFSARAVEVLRDAMEVYFHVLPVTLHSVPYFTLGCKQRLNILDTEKSQIDIDTNFPNYDPSNLRPEDISGIYQYYFKDKKSLPDPVIFSIPQQRNTLYCTESVVQLAREANLKGIRFQVLDSPRGSPKAINEGWGGWEWNE